MNDPFHATLKLVTGEEILAQVVVEEENGTQFFMLSEAITIGENVSIDKAKGVANSGLTPRLWMGYAGDDLVIVNKEHVITISEMDRFGVEFYERALQAARASSPIKKLLPTKEHTGYLGSVTNVDFLNRCFGMDT